MPTDTISQVQLKTLIGEFSVDRAEAGSVKIAAAWSKASLTIVDLPIVGLIRCTPPWPRIRPQHYRTRRPWPAFVDQRARQAKKKWVLQRTRGKSYFGKFWQKPSRHSWGAAIALNPTNNLYGGPSKMDAHVIEVFARHRFAWGGTFLVPNPMHFGNIG